MSTVRTHCIKINYEIYILNTWKSTHNLIIMLIIFNMLMTMFVLPVECSCVQAQDFCFVVRPHQINFILHGSHRVPFFKSQIKM